MRLLLTRPDARSRETATALEARGHEAIVAPLLEIEPLEPGPVDLAGVQALAFTSANGVDTFAARFGARGLPVFTVGAATARAARAAGFSSVTSADGSAADLAALLAARLDPAAGVVLHPCAEELAFSLAEALRPAGLGIREAPFYRAVTAPDLPEAAVRALREHGVDGALFFSLRTAGQFVRLAAKADLLPALAPVAAFALSDPIARSLARVRWRTVRVAERPDLAGLLDVVDREVDR